MITFRGIVDDYISCCVDGPRKSYLDSLAVMVSPASTNFAAFFFFFFFILITAVTSSDDAGWAMLQHCREGGHTHTPPLWKGTREEGDREEGQPCELMESAVWVKKGD